MFVHCILGLEIAGGGTLSEVNNCCGSFEDTNFLISNIPIRSGARKWITGNRCLSEWLHYQVLPGKGKLGCSLLTLTADQTLISIKGKLGPVSSKSGLILTNYILRIIHVRVDLCNVWRWYVTARYFLVFRELGHFQ